MNQLAKYLVEQIEGKTIAVFGGGFKPPTKGHFSVVKQALKQNPEIEEFRVYVGTGERDGISQSQSTMIWNIYAKYLPFKVEIIPSEKAPIRAIYNTAKDNPQSEVLWVIGAREGNEDDFKDIASRTTSVNKYPNLELRTIVSKDGVSGTAARNALNQTPEKFTSFLPDELSDDEKQEVVNILSSAPLNEGINDPITVLSVIDPKRNLDEDQIIELFGENVKFYIYVNEEGEYENERQVDKHEARDYVDYYNARLKRNYAKEEKLGAKLKVLGIESELRFKRNYFSLNENVENVDYKKKIVEFTKHMVDQGENIQPLPKVIFKYDEQEADDFFGKTAYYQPDTQTIVLYVKDRHPKDIVRSYSHEMIHHIQNLENRLGAVTTTDTNEDDNLDKIEREAYLDGNITFRNWTDTFVGDQMLRENYNDYKEFGKDIIIQAYMYFDEAYPLDPNKINLSDSIHFVSKRNDIPKNKQRIKNVIFKQLMEAYRGTALESFNKKHNFTPEFNTFAGGGSSWDAPSGIFQFSPSFFKWKDTTNSDGEPAQTLRGFFASKIEYASGIEAYDPNNDSIKKAAQQLGPLLNPMFDPSNLDNSPNNNSEVTPELDAILEVAPVTFIPFIEIPQGIDDKDDKLVKSHQSKKVWKDIFNELGLECINYLKDPEWKMSNPQQMAESIVGDKIECDNCGWSWKIVDGGDDLFICHKCGNDNTPINENLFSKNIQESIISDIREYGNLPEYKIDLNDTYDYNSSNNFFEFYDDINNVDVIAKVKSLSKGVTEFKFYPIKGGKSLGFIKLSKSNPKIMNTIFKIFLNEVLSKYDKILIQPSDYTRYRLFRAMLSNNLDKKDYKIGTNDDPIGQSSLYVQKLTTNELEEKTKDPFGLTAYAAELGRLREDEGEYKLYLDMDGVVADFDRRFRELSGMAPKEFENKHGKNKFWDFIDEGDNKIKFWVGIPPMPGAQELVSFINSNFDYEMLTAPSIKKQSRLGKNLWIRNWTNKGLFPSKPKVNFKPAKNKKDFAAPNHILVDDKPSTIDAWNTAGGIGILFQSAEQVINDLQQYVKKGV